MRLPVIQGVIDRRVLVNFRVDPAALSRVLPAPFRPMTVAGVGIAGVCLIRLRGVRPRGAPACLGVGSENAAHRIAVQWDDAGQTRRGVYIPRRDTSSRFNHLAGGRLFPGVHHHARFDVEEHGDCYRVALESDDGQTRVAVEGRTADALPSDSVFPSLQAVSDFFEEGSLGYSATRRPGEYDGLELSCRNWSVRPMDVTHVESSFFQDTSRFPAGAVQFDNALLMRRSNTNGTAGRRCVRRASACEGSGSATRR